MWNIQKELYFNDRGKRCRGQQEEREVIKTSLYTCSFAVCLQLGGVKKQLCPEVFRPEGLQLIVSSSYRLRKSI